MVTNILINAAGYIGSAALAFCAAPQAWACLKTGRADGLSSSFLGLWTLGEISTLIYILGTSGDRILLANYAFNLGCLSIILWVKLCPKA